MDTITANEKKYNKWIWILSIAIPVVVALLFSISPKDIGYHGAPLTSLPPIYATINGLTAILLIMAYSAIRKGKIKTHETLVKICIGLSVAFLAMYVAYHMTSESVKYGDIDGNGVLDQLETAKVGLSRYLYLFILLTHILLSIIIIPFVLITFVRGISGAYQRHKRIARITFPMWLYVAITGVIVYLMISPYYVHA